MHDKSGGVTMASIPTQYELEMHGLRLLNAGYTIVPNAIPPDYLARLNVRFDEMIANYQTIPTSQLHPETNAVDINKIIDVDPLFDDLLDLPSVFPIAEGALDGQIQLLGSPIGNYTPPGASPRGAWHHDGAPYIRFTYFLNDISEDEGPTAVLPGSHHRGEKPPEWLNVDGLPRAVPGMQLATGAAGTCMVNNTHIWHTGTPNVSQKPRKIVWVVFKHADWPDKAPDHLSVSPEFAARQTLPLRRRLCGLTD